MRTSCLPSSLLPIVLLLLTMSSCEPDKTKTMGLSCIRHTRLHFLMKDHYSLSYLDRFSHITRDLVKNYGVGNLTASIVLKSLENASKNLCQVNLNNVKRPKRQLVMGGMIGLLSGVLPVIVGHLLFPPQPSPEIANFMRRTRTQQRKTQLMLQTLSERLEKLEKRQEADELLITILETLHLEEQKFRELIQSDTTDSPTLARMLKVVFKAYERAGILKITPRTMSKNLSRNYHYHLNVTTIPGNNCEEAKVEITLYAPLPSNLCEQIVETSADYILTSITNSEDCRILPPIFTLVSLPDDTAFSPLQHYRIKGCDVSGSNFTFKLDSTRTAFLAIPKEPGAVIANCGGIRRANLAPNHGVTPLLGCTSHLSSGHDRPTERDLFAPGGRLTNERGEVIDPGFTIGSEFLFIETVSNATITKSTRRPQTSTTEYEEWLDEIKSTSSTAVRDASIATLSGIVTFLTIFIALRFIKRLTGRTRKWTIQNSPQTASPAKRLTTEDIEVQFNHGATVDLKLAALSNEMSSLSHLGSFLNHVEPVNETEYNIELVPMPDAPATCDSDHV